MAYCRSLRFTWQTLHPCSCATDVVSGWHLASSRNNSQHLALQVRDPQTAPHTSAVAQCTFAAEAPWRVLPLRCSPKTHPRT